MALAGTPADVLDGVRRIREVPEIRRVILLPQVPDRDFIERETILELFADEVMARL